MTTESELKLEKYQYGVDVQKTRQLYGMSGKILYNGRWISSRTDRIIIVEMSEAIAEHEAFFYRELNGHDHIIRTFGYVENPLNATIYVQEYADRGDLANFFLDNEMNISQNILIEIFSQVADAMSYVISKSIVHGDLGCRNVLVYRIDSIDPKNTLVKITDFGLARSLNHRKSMNANALMIPMRYCAPEILQDDNESNYSEKSDVYSMGVFMWEALSNGEMPYSSIASDDIIKQMKLDNAIKLTQPPFSDSQLWLLLGKCWCFDPKQRISFEQIKEQLSEIIVSELSDIHLSISTIQPPIPYGFKLNIDVQIGESLKGSFDKIYEAEWISKAERPIVLIKTHKQPTEHELLCYKEFQSHPHIIHTFGFVENDLQSMLLLQERAPHGNLQELLQINQFHPSTRVLVNIFIQIIDAMICINKQNFIHGDLRCANVLVFQMNESNPEENLIKLTNFTSVHRNDPPVAKDQRTMIPVRYCALEILRSAGRSNYSEMSDVYSMGVLMWEFCSDGRIPYSSAILNSEVRQRKLNGEKLIMPWLCDLQIWSIMEDCWYNEPELRFNFEAMKIRLSNITFESEKTYQYRMNVDIKIGNPLSGKFGKQFYEAQWILKKKRPIILLVMNEETARQEVPFYRAMSHKHIVRTFGLVRHEPQSTTLLQERAPCDHFQKMLQTNRFQPSGSVLVNIFVQIIDAMIYLVGKNITHRDLCCKNILIFQMHSSHVGENLIKLTNFNLAHQSDSSFIDKRQVQISVRYCAPEVLQHSNYSELSDVYSMGSLMWQAYSKGNIPFGTEMNDDDIRTARSNGEKLPKPFECLPEIWSIIDDCWYTEPELRYSFKEMQVRLSGLCTRCSHCQDQYLTDDMLTHSLLCLPKCPPIPDRIRSSQTPQPTPKRTTSFQTPHRLEVPSTENSTEPLENSMNTRASNQIPSQPQPSPPIQQQSQATSSTEAIPTSKPSKNIFNRLFSLFGKGKKKK